MLKEGAKSSLVEDTGQKLEAEFIQVRSAVLVMVDLITKLLHMSMIISKA